MKNVRLYQNTPLQIGKKIILDEYGYHHLVKVLRFPQGKNITLFNGDGTNYLARVDKVKKYCEVDIVSSEKNQSESKLNITLAQGVAKGEKMDFLIQKAVELGVTSIVPIMSERCVVKLNGERLAKRHKHWERVIIGASEQSGRSVIPDLAKSISFNEFVNLNINNGLILHHRAELPLIDIEPLSEVVIIIGPEGGFTSAEIDHALKSNCRIVSLGPRILRTETASIAAIANLQMLWGS